MHISGRVVGMFLGGLLAQPVNPSLSFPLSFFFIFPLTLSLSVWACVCARVRVLWPQRKRSLRASLAAPLLLLPQSHHLPHLSKPVSLHAGTRRTILVSVSSAVLCCVISYCSVLCRAVPRYIVWKGARVHTPALSQMGEVKFPTLS